jgi:hypothetical protein
MGKLTKEQATCIYYTASTEKEPFASNIRRRLLKTIGDLPLISVSQKPLDFGLNICVGDVGVNEFNEWRQVKLGCEKATTPFVIVAEADALYPPSYFDFVPEKLDRVYRYDNVWIMRVGRPFFLKKDWTEGAQILGREYFISLIEKSLEGRPMWTKEYSQIDKRKPVFPYKEWDYFTGDPVVSVKTGDGMRLYTGTQRNTPGEYSLPYWGTEKELERNLL